ncbi:MAG: hypothetical protein RJB13_1148 [Pseudomonadota bacterium]
MVNQHSHFAFENHILEAFKARDLKKLQWSEGLHHVVPHEYVSHISLHHQHAQYHLILFWIENLFSNAARWLGVRELARLSLDYIENSPFLTDNAIAHAEHFIEVIGSKNEIIQIAQLEALMRCGLACWKVRSAPWRTELDASMRGASQDIKKRIEFGQMAFVQSPGSWSVYELWQASAFGALDASTGESDVWVVRRDDELTLAYERWTPEQYQQLTSI